MHAGATYTLCTPAKQHNTTPPEAQPHHAHFLCTADGPISTYLERHAGGDHAQILYLYLCLSDAAPHHKGLRAKAFTQEHFL